MIKFFRIIRQRLLSENKFSRYLIYALGEIKNLLESLEMAIRQAEAILSKDD